MAIVTNILSTSDSTTNLRDALMAATGWWERMDPEQRKAYIKKASALQVRTGSQVANAGYVAG